MAAAAVAALSSRKNTGISIKMSSLRFASLRLFNTMDAKFLFKFRNLSFHIFDFFDDERQHRCIIDGLILIFVFISDHNIRKDFLNFMCDKPIFVFLE